MEGAIASKFRNAGQTCVCANRMFVHASVYDAFVAKLAAATAALPVGDGMVEGVKVGPVISRAALEKTEAFVADALARGAKVVTGGKRPAHTGGKGHFYEPTVLKDVTAECGVMRDEIFGPVVSAGAHGAAGDACTTRACRGGSMRSWRVCRPACVQAPVASFTDEADVIAQANSADVGLAGYFFTK